MTLVASRLWWGYYAESQLVAEIDKYRQTGQMVFPEEFDRELDAVPREQNAAILLEEAARIVVRETPRGVTFEDFHTNPALFDENPAAAKELLGLNATALDLIRRARKKPEAAWSLRLEGCLPSQPLGMWSRSLALAKLLRFRATYYYGMGNHAEAIETVRDLLALGDDVGSYPLLVFGEIASPIRGFAWWLIEDICPNLNVRTSAATPRATPSAVDREIIEALVAELLDEEGINRTAVRHMLGDRALLLGTLDMFVNKGVPLSGGFPGPYWYETNTVLGVPYLKLGAVSALRLYTVMSEAAAAPTWPGAKQVIAGSSASTWSSRLHDLPWRPWDSLTGVLERGYEGLALRRMAATALAIRLFVVDHGHRPVELSELVPEYLPAVPMDPLSRSGTPIRYEPDAVPPVLYSTGLDGEDNGGAGPQRPDGSLNSEASDLVFHLDGRAADDEGKCSLLELLGLESAEPPP